MKVKSITTKFILIISVLMAFVMAIQLYYNTRTQEDILTELNRLKQSINSATDRILIERYEPGAVSVFSDSLIWSHKPFINEIDVGEDQLVVGGNSKVWNYKSPQIKADIQQKLNTAVIIDSLHVFPPGTGVKLPRDRSHIKFNKMMTDSDGFNFEIVEYDLNPQQEEKSVNSFFYRKNSGKNSNVISFEFPNFVSSDEPAKLRYNYSTAEFNNALEDIRDRNLLLTLGLFALSLVMIATVTGKFLKPIKSLNRSFDKVVQGDLDVVVEPKTSDEIGELSASFNHMVNELRKNKDREELMHRQQRLASLGQLAAGVAHEIKNPLNAINLTIEHLQDKFVGAEETQAVAYIQTIQKEIRRLDKTVNNLLNYLRSENITKRETDINHLVDEILHLYERETSASHINIIRDYSKKCIINLDEERFKTVLMNIITNAIQAIENTGSITIRTRQEQKMISIEDSGKGIPRKNLENIFDLFYTTKSAGTGLGLPTAYKIMQQHGGYIQIESRENLGTKVILTFNEQD